MAFSNWGVWRRWCCITTSTSTHKQNLLAVIYSYDVSHSYRIKQKCTNTRGAVSTSWLTCPARPYLPDPKPNWSWSTYNQWWCSNKLAEIEGDTKRNRTHVDYYWDCNRLSIFIQQLLQQQQWTDCTIKYWATATAIVRLMWAVLEQTRLTSSSCTHSGPSV